MADAKPAALEVDIDVDSLSDEEFAAFKEKMAEDPPADDPPATVDEPKADEPAKVEEPAADDDDDDDPAPGTVSETVPHKKFHRERERRKETEAKLQAAQEREAKINDRLAQLLEMQAKPAEAKVEAPAIPEFSRDPINAGQWTQEQVKSLSERLDQRDAAAEEQRAWQQTLDRANFDFETEAKTDPTIRDAYVALRQSYAREYQAMGYRDQELLQVVNQQEAWHIRNAVGQGKNVASYVRELATARGWTKPAPQQQAPVVPDTSAAETAAKREEARKAGLSLGSSGGGITNTGRPSPEQVLEMSDAEFDAFKKKYGSVSRAFED